MENEMEKELEKGLAEKKTVSSGQIRAWIVNIYLMIMLGIYPLFLVNGYMDLVYKKWAMFLYVTAVALLVSLIWGQAGGIWKKERANWLPMDWFVLAYFICVVISFAGAADKGTSLWGIETWYTGFVAQVLFVGIYFMVSLGYKKMPYLDGIGAAAGVITGIMIILQRFGIDILHLYRGFGDDVKENFVAALGQVTWTSSYLSILLTAGLGIYFCTGERKRRVWLGICIGIGFAAEMVLNCDSGIITLIAAVMIMIWLAVGNRERIMRILEIMLIALAAAAAVGIGERVFGGRMVAIDDIYLKVAQNVFLYPAMAVLVLFYWLIKREKIHIIGNRKWTFAIRGIFLGVVCLGIAAVAALFVAHGKGYFSGSPTENYFRFTVWWGNSRGFIWRVGAAVFGDFGIWRKLFGCGPDGFTPYAYQLMGDAINEFWHNQLVPNVHNEWFNAVINYGLIGGLAYLGIFVSSAYACMKSALAEKEGKRIGDAAVFGAGLAAAGYIAHNVLCYQQIIGTPLIFVLMGIGAAKMRQERCDREG